MGQLCLCSLDENALQRRGQRRIRHAMANEQAHDRSHHAQDAIEDDARLVFHRMACSPASKSARPRLSDAFMHMER
jgi:hypothetical protein